MEKVTVSRLKNELSAYLRKVRGGKSVLVYDRDTPVARLVPLAQQGGAGGADEERLLRLEGEGVVRRGRPGPIELPALPGDWPQVDTVGALLEDRESARW